jgi:hypothetical protein
MVSPHFDRRTSKRIATLKKTADSSSLLETKKKLNFPKEVVRRKKNLNICYQNIQCLHNKILLLNELIDIRNFDLLTFSEHWQNKDNLKFIKFSNFELASFFSRENKIHGGTVIYAKQGIISVERNDIINLNSELDFEVSAVEVKNLNKIYCGLYTCDDVEIFLIHYCSCWI